MTTRTGEDAVLGGARPLHVAVDGACWANDRGYGRFTRHLVSALAARGPTSGIRCTLVLERRPDSAAPLPLGLDVRVAGLRGVAEAVRGGGARDPLHLARMGSALAEVGADLVFFPALYSWVPVLGRAPQVVTVHDAIPERHPRLVFPTRRSRFLWGLKRRAALLRATRVLTVSGASARATVEQLGVPADRVDTTTEAADPVFRPLPAAAGAEVRAALGLPAGPLLVHVGGFNPHKNLRALLEAVALLPPPRPSLALVGDTSGRGFHDEVPAIRSWLAARPDVAAGVAMPGRLPDDVLVRLLAAADALVFPSLEEGFGLPAVEAMACGRAVLASAGSALEEVVGDGGLLFDPHVPASIAATITGFLADPVRRAAIEAAALRRAAAFTWDDAARRAEDCFRRAVRRA